MRAQPNHTSKAQRAQPAQGIRQRPIYRNCCYICGSTRLLAMGKAPGGGLVHYCQAHLPKGER